jgi:hypothetical protein
MIRKTTSKALSLRSLKGKLDRIFSEYVRLRDSDANGYCRCISCGKICRWKEMDAGHFVNRSHMSLRYDERNVNAQCRKCNRFDEGNPTGYMRGLKEKYGSGIIEMLEVKKHTVSRMTRFDYELLTAHYKFEGERLRREKGL